MKRKFITTLLILSMSALLVSCGSDKTTEKTSAGSSKPVENAQEEEVSAQPTNLSGIWASKENEGSYQEAIITDSTIEINWISDGGKTRSIYWVGSYEAPTDAVEEYSWISERDKAKTDSALLASTDDSKTFSYKDGVISYEVSAFGTTSTLELSQTSKEVPLDTTETSSSTEGSSSTEPLYETAYENISFFTDDIGQIHAQAIVEVKNTSSQELYLDYASYELRSDTGTIIHTSSGTFTPYPSIIEPGESAFYYESAFMDSGTPTENISITPHLSVSPSQNDMIRLDVKNTEIYDKNDFDSFDLHGEITNTTDEPQELITVAAVLFDKENKPFGVLSNILEIIQPGDSIGFELETYDFPADISTADISDYKVFAYPTQYQY